MVIYASCTSCDLKTRKKTFTYFSTDVDISKNYSFYSLIDYLGSKRSFAVTKNGDKFYKSVESFIIDNRLRKFNFNIESSLNEYIRENYPEYFI